MPIQKQFHVCLVEIGVMGEAKTHSGLHDPLTGSAAGSVLAKNNLKAIHKLYCKTISTKNF